MHGLPVKYELNGLRKQVQNNLVLPSSPKYSWIRFLYLNTYLFEYFSGCCDSLEGFYKDLIFLVQEGHSGKFRFDFKITDDL